MTDRKRILIVEDEPALAEIIRDYLVQADMDAEILDHGATAVATILATQPDLVVLDVMLPGKDGLEICKEVRRSSTVPIILETARVEEIDRLLGLELGADDYLCKPFSPRELVARVKAIFRRMEMFGATGATPLPDQRLALDADSWRSTLDGQPLDLTRREFQLLAVLHQRPGRVLSRSQLIELAYADEADVFDRTIDSHIKNLRRKLKDVDPDWDPIRSVYGVGYAYEG